MTRDTVDRRFAADHVCICGFAIGGEGREGKARETGRGNRVSVLRANNG